MQDLNEYFYIFCIFTLKGSFSTTAKKLNVYCKLFQKRIIFISFLFI